MISNDIATTCDPRPVDPHAPARRGNNILTMTFPTSTRSDEPTSDQSAQENPPDGLGDQQCKVDAPTIGRHFRKAHDAFCKWLQSNAVFIPGRAGGHVIRRNNGQWDLVRSEVAEEWIKHRMSKADPCFPEDSEKLMRDGLKLPKWYLNLVSEDNRAEYAGPVPGYCTGFRTMAGRRVLVDTSTILQPPKEGVWTTIRSILETRLDSESLKVFYGWLKVNREAFESERPLPCRQALFLVGPPDCGKSFIQDMIITPIFGGKDASPARYLAGESTFNKELFEATHLKIEDKIGGSSRDSRHYQTLRFKELLSNVKQEVHPKFGTPVMLEPLWVVTVSLNDDPASLRIVPDLDGAGLEGKVSVLRINGPHPMPDLAPAESSLPKKQALLVRQIETELPAFLYFLLKQWNMPSRLYHHRTGVAAYVDPVIAVSLSELHPATRLWSMICHSFWQGRAADESKEGEVREYTVVELYDQLRFTFNSHVDAFLGSEGYANTLLTKLAKDQPEHVVKGTRGKVRGKDGRRINTPAKWRFSQPQSCSDFAKYTYTPPLSSSDSASMVN